MEPDAQQVDDGYGNIWMLIYSSISKGFDKPCPAGSVQEACSGKGKRVL